MTLNNLVKIIAVTEGKESQARVGDIREILGILSDLIYSDANVASEVTSILFQAGQKRAKRKSKSKN